MKATLKILGQVAVSTDDVTTIYTVPANTSTVISKLSVCNTTIVTQAVSVYVVASTASTASKTTNTVAETYSQIRSFVLGVGDFLDVCHGVTLSAGDLVRVKSNSSVSVGAAFSLYGQENS